MMTYSRQLNFIIAIHSVLSTGDPFLLYLDLILAHGLVVLAGEGREWREEVVGRAQAGAAQLGGGGGASPVWTLWY